MDKRFVVTQLINAAITIVTTILVVRFTLKGSLGISPILRARFKSTARRYADIVLFGLTVVMVIVALYRDIFSRGTVPATHADAFIIAMLVVIGVFSLKEINDSILAIIERRRRRKPKSQPNEQANDLR